MDLDNKNSNQILDEPPLLILKKRKFNNDWGDLHNNWK